MQYEHVFRDLRAFAQCHAATAVRRRDGGFYLAWFAGTHEGHADTAIWAAECGPRSLGSLLDGSSVWSAPRSIAKVSNRPHWNPVLFATSPEKFVLHFKVGSRIRDWITWTQISDDAGNHWQRAVPLVQGDRSARGAVKNKPIQLSSGDWLAGSSTESWRSWNAFVDRSPDGLGGWQASPTFPIARSRLRGKGIIQPTLWQSSENDVHALLRSTEGTLYRSDSSDAGLRWSEARPIPLANNNSGIDLVQMQNGTLALACNPVEGNWAARTPLSILFSHDNGESWPDRLDIETGPGEFSYPALIEDEGGLFIAFTWNRRRIAVAHIGSDEIPKP